MGQSNECGPRPSQVTVNFAAQQRTAALHRIKPLDSGFDDKHADDEVIEDADDEMFSTESDSEPVVTVASNKAAEDDNESMDDLEASTAPQDVKGASASANAQAGPSTGPSAVAIGKMRLREEATDGEDEEDSPVSSRSFKVSTTPA